MERKREDWTILYLGVQDMKTSEGTANNCDLY